MRMKFLSVMTLAALSFGFSCKETGKGVFIVDGTFKNADKLGSSGPLGAMKVYLQEVQYGKDQPPVSLDSAKLTGNSGTFSLKGFGRSQAIYELVFGENMVVPVINDVSEINVAVDLGKKDDYYTVSGSDASRKLLGLISGFGKKSYQVERSFAILDSMKRSNAPDSTLIAYTMEKNKAIQDLNNYLRNFIQTNSNPTLCVLALSWSSSSLSRTDFEKELNSLITKYPDNNVLQGMKKSFDMQQAEMTKRLEANGWTGKKVPELALPDTEGKTISLSSFRGKYLLVDFWASWCSPCRQENPNVVRAYQEFKNKNFTILGVSLDKEKDPWIEAIRQDKLEWTQVSDLKYWNSKAVELFKFEGIPFNLLIDPEGKVIAQELRGTDLENKLKEVLK
jgi:peroxiredoxin